MARRPLRGFALQIAALAVLLLLALTLSCGASDSTDTVRLPERDQDWNVVLIIIDTLRADHLGSYGYGRDTSPSIDMLAAQSTLFENAYSASSWTRPAVASILTGQLPTEHGVVADSKLDYLADAAVTLAESLSESGYQTFASITQPHYKFGLLQGFQGTWYEAAAPADKAIAEAISWLRETQSENFYLLVHLVDPHDPWHFRKAYSFTKPKHRVLRVPDRLKLACPVNVPTEETIDRQEMIDLYDGEIAFADAQIGRLLGFLEGRGDLHRTVVVITSDHGEEFGEHGGLFHGCTLYQELLRVPLIVYVPDAARRLGSVSRVVKEPVSTRELFATLQALSRADGPASTSGAGLLPLLLGRSRASRPLVSSTAFRTPLKHAIVYGSRKLVWDVKSDVYEMYDLAADPREKHNLLAGVARRDGHAASRPVAGVAELKQRLAKLEARAPWNRVPEAFRAPLAAPPAWVRLDSGWAKRHECAHGRCGRRNTGSVSRLAWRLPGDPGSVDLRLRLRPTAVIAPAAIEVIVNGRRIGQVITGEGLALPQDQDPLPIPESVLRAGENDFSFHYHRVGSPGSGDSGSDDENVEPRSLSWLGLELLPDPSHSTRKRFDRTEREPDRETERDLEALGYVEGKQ